MKNVLVVSGCNPHSIANFESANSGTYYVVRGLVKRGYDVTFLRANFKLPDWPEPALVEKIELENAGVKFLPDLKLFERKAYPSRLRRILGMLSGDPNVLCRGAQYFEDFKEAIDEHITSTQ